MRVMAEIDLITADQHDVLIRNSQLIASIESYLSDLKQFVLKYEFCNPDEEIEFFKTIKPWFVSQLLFYERVFKINLFESYHAKDAKLKYFQKQLVKLEEFMTCNQEFYHYILSKADHMDQKYFSRSNGGKVSIIVDDRFSTTYDIKLSKIQCNERIKNYLITAIRQIESPSSLPADSALTWTGSKTDLIELIYALQGAGVFNKESADVKQIASHFETVFNVSLGNYYRVFQDIRLRKNSQVKFLDSLKNALVKRIVDSNG